VDFRPVAVFSLVPLAIALRGLSNRCAGRAGALPHAVANIRGYFIFQTLLALYLLITAAGSLLSP
jgi:1,4-dihydroxy-2-naphthoate polyprenyltransferase